MNIFYLDQCGEWFLHHWKHFLYHVIMGGIRLREDSWLQVELERAKKQGLTVQIEGMTCKYDSTAELSYVLERATYMLDYVSDDEGRITGICFDKVNEKDLVGKACTGQSHKS